jgi:hypothetical protein
MSTPREGVKESLAHHKVTSCRGSRLTATMVDTLRKDIAKMAVTVKTTLFPQGERHRCLAAVLQDVEYGAIIGDPDYEFEDVVNVEDYDPDITNTMNEAQWEKRKTDKERYGGFVDIAVEKIEEAVSHQYLRELRDEYVGLSGLTIHEIFEHLVSKVKLTTAQRAQLRDEINIKWDQTQDVVSYFLLLKKHKRDWPGGRLSSPKRSCWMRR